MSHHHHHDLAVQNLLRSQRDIAREEARTRMGDPPNTACRLKLAVGAKPDINDKMADRGREALRGPIVGFVLFALLFLPWGLPSTLWFLVVLVPWALVLLMMWSQAPEKHAAELERRQAHAPTVTLPTVPDPVRVHDLSTGRHTR